MKHIYLLAVMAILISSGGCTLANDTPRHAVDEVTTIARSFNTQCRIQIGEESCG